MRIKRIISTLIGFPAVAILLIFGNIYTFDILMAVIGCMCIYEYNKAFKDKYKPIKYMGYCSAILLAFIHIIPQPYLVIIAGFLIPAIVIIAFIQSIITKCKINVIDIAITLFGIVYVIGFLAFLSLTYNAQNGKFIFWYILIAAWGSDTFAYLIGIKFGKHKLCSISPKKTIEGSIAGIVGAGILNIIYTIILNNIVGLNLNIWYMLLIGIVLSIIGQFGDIAASTIKRFNNIKDFSQLIPGHGGMLDRIDSVIFIAPVAYLLLVIIL